MTMSLQTGDLFDFSATKSILQPFLPLELDNDAGLRMSECDSKHLWPLIKKIISPHILSHSQDFIFDDSNFPYLFYIFMHSYMQINQVKEELIAEKGEKDSAIKIIKTFIHRVPDELCRSVLDDTNGNGAKKKLRKILHTHYENNHKGD